MWGRKFRHPARRGSGHGESQVEIWGCPVGRFFRRRKYPWWAWAFIIVPAMVTALAKAFYWGWRLWDYAQATGPW